MCDPNASPLGIGLVQPIMDELFDLGLGIGVQGRSGLVQEKHFRLKLDGPHEGHDLGLAAGQIDVPFGQEGGIPVPSAKGIDEAFVIVAAVGVGRVMKGQSQIIFDGPFHECRSLMEINDPATKDGNLGGRDGVAAKQDLAAVEGVQHGQGPEEQGLSRSGGSDDKNPITAQDR
jgi:hypothetical protein